MEPEPATSRAPADALPAVIAPQRVTVVAFDMPFLQLTLFMIKASFAAALATIVTSAIWIAIGTVMMAVMIFLGTAMLAMLGIGGAALSQ